MLISGMNNEEEKLKLSSGKLKPDPCPFCGAKAYLAIFYNVYGVECSNCHAEGPMDEDGNYWNTPEEAINAWNRRKEQ